ncbi:histidine-type phosphatase, partial [Xanthomonas citri pv. citri]|nr:histidine-type phosphatase [Xanthomonas citri pv. citri]
ANRLLTNIVETAQDYVTTNRKGATLRFAHDGNLIPLAARMMIEDTYGMENCPDSLYKSWANFKVAPMAGNIQLIFYRNPADADAPVMTKVMLNERE